MTDEKISRATVEFPRSLWLEFMVHVKRKGVTASALIREFVRDTLEKEGEKS